MYISICLYFYFNKNYVIINFNFSVIFNFNFILIWFFIGRISLMVKQL